jgi:hypothetical protein
VSTYDRDRVQIGRRKAVNMIETFLEQVVSSAIEQVGRAECQRIFGGLYVFDAPLGLFFELSDATPRR